MSRESQIIQGTDVLIPTEGDMAERDNANVPTARRVIVSRGGSPQLRRSFWYLMFPVSYRDLELMLLDRGVEVDHTTIFRWIQAYATELEKPIRPHLRMSNGSWRADKPTSG